MLRGMRILLPVLSLILLWPAGASWAQLSPPNKAGVAMGHLHYTVRDVEANKKFWVSLGAQSIKLGTTEIMKFSDVLIFLSQGESAGGTQGSVVNHVAFRVQSLAKLQAAGMKVQLLAQFPGVGSVISPEGERIELFDDLAENVTFTLDDGQNDLAAGRHNRRMTVPIIFHHVHLYLPEGSDAEAKAWYVKMFGGIPGTRWHYAAADLPGINMNFSGNPARQVPTTGRMLDHIGFEVKNLEAFCKKLEASGVKLDVPYTKQSTGIATAFLTDPWGTSIELTEGLNRL